MAIFVRLRDDALHTPGRRITSAWRIGARETTHAVGAQFPGVSQLARRSSNTGCLQFRPRSRLRGRGPALFAGPRASSCGRSCRCRHLGRVVVVVEAGGDGVDRGQDVGGGGGEDAGEATDQVTKGSGAAGAVLGAAGARVHQSGAGRPRVARAAARRCPAVSAQGAVAEEDVAGVCSGDCRQGQDCEHC